MIIHAALMEAKQLNRVSLAFKDFSSRLISKSLISPGILPDGSGLRLIPEGMVHETGTKCILGNGVIVEPSVLLEDFKNLEKNNIDYKDRLLIS